MQTDKTVQGDSDRKIYKSPEIKAIKLSPHCSILTESGGNAGGDSGGEDPWDS